VTVLGLRDRVKIKFGNFFAHDLSEATVVTCYLLSDTNKKLEGKLLEELPNGARVVSNTFNFPGMQFLTQEGEAKLYLSNPA
jgi:hypothetical protein